MKKLPIVSLLFFCILFFSHCHHPKIDPMSSKIDFSKLTIGQKSLYVRFDIQHIYDLANTSFTQTKDTVSLTVVAKDTKGFKIAETHLDASEPPVFYYFRPVGDSLFVEPIDNDDNSLNSVLFNFKHTTFILKDTGLPTWALNRWAIPTSLDQTEKIEFAKVKNFTIMGNRYNKAIAYYNGQDSVFDGFSRVILYSAKNGFICFHAFGGRAGTGYSYQLI
jgi:hypothetical protein